MSEQLELVRTIYAAWERGDYSSVAWAHTELEYTIADGPSPGSWSGVTGMVAGFREILAAWEDWGVVADEYLELPGDRVLVSFTCTGRGKTSGVDLAQLHVNGATLFEVDNGRVTRIVQYFERSRALADLGLAGATTPDAAFARNVERLRAFYEAFNTSKLINPDWLAPDVEFKQPDELGGGEGIYHGRAGFARGVQELLDIFEGFRADPETFIDAGAYIVVNVRLSGRARVSRVPFDDPYAHVVRFRGEQIDLWHAYSDRDQALEAVGLAG